MQRGTKVVNGSSLTGILVTLKFFSGLYFFNISLLKKLYCTNVINFNNKVIIVIDLNFKLMRREKCTTEQAHL